MYVLNKTDDYKSYTECTIKDNGDINIIVKVLLLSIPSSILILCLIGLVIYTLTKPVING